MNLDELEQLAKAATPGPWREGFPPPNGTTTVGTMQGLMTAHCFNGKDSAFIAAANPETVLTLCALARERDALAAQVVALKSEFSKQVALCGPIDEMVQRAFSIAHKALTIDTSAAEAILRERDAKVLEEAAEALGKSITRPNPYVTPDNASYFAHWLRRMAAERRAGK